MPLTDREIRNLKPKARSFKVYDELGLFLAVQPSGSRWWRFRYKLAGKEKLLSLGTYPTVSLSMARARRDEARALLDRGTDPSEKRRLAKFELAELRVQEEHTFEAVARRWLDKSRDEWSPGHLETIESRLRRDVFPFLGERQVASLAAPEVLAVLERVVARGARETAKRELQYVGQVMRYAIACGIAANDPTAALQRALATPQVRHHAAIVDPRELGALLRAIEGYRGSPIVRAALRLAPHVFVRPGELRHMEWDELDGDLWSLPAEKLKRKEPHVVPLSTQARSIIDEVHPLTGHGRYVFPSARSFQRPLSENAVLAALRRLGFSKEEATGHGFRATARTLLDEVLHFAPHLIEHQLAHAVRDPLGRAYNRTMHLPDRRRMMQTWSDYLDELREGAQVIPFRRSAS